MIEQIVDYLSPYDERRLKNKVVQSFGNPINIDLLVVQDGITVENQDISGNLFFSIYDEDSEKIGHVFVDEDRKTIFDIQKNSYCQYVVSPLLWGEYDKPIFVTHDIRQFLALENAYIPVACFPTRNFSASSIKRAVLGLLKSGYSDVRVLCAVPDMQKANESVAELGASVWFTEDSPEIEDIDYTKHIMKNMIHERTERKAIDQDLQDYDSWNLIVPFEKRNKLEAGLYSGTRYESACCAYAIARLNADRCPAFLSLSCIEKTIQTNLVSKNTVNSIMKRIEFSVNRRKEKALKAVRISDFGKHNHVVVDSLKNVVISDGVTLITAPTASGKTKDVIMPFSKSARNDGKFLAIAPLVSLINELSDKLQTENYANVRSRDEAMSVDAMSVCLPSIKSMILRPFINSVTHIAIDEVSQNVRFTASTSCSVKGASSEDVYFELKKLINESKCIVAADASLDDETLRFFEQARPNEVFNIVDMTPKNTGRKCFIYESMSDLISVVIKELVKGGKVWLSVESADRASVLESIFSKDYKTLMINSDSKGRKEQSAFLSNASAESLKYDLVIASPTISSGISIEHQKPHFSLIAGVSSGNRICPTDFMQMLARVRYVANYHVCLMPNNVKDNLITTESILHGQRQAGAIEGKAILENEYSLFKASNDVNSLRYRADFANGFYWIMEYFKFEIVRLPDSMMQSVLKKQIQDASAEMKAQKIEKIKQAEQITQEQAEKFAIETVTEKEAFELLAFNAKKQLGYAQSHQLTDEDIEMKDHVKAMDRLQRYFGNVTNFDDSDKNIALRTFEKAQAQAYSILFGGVDVASVAFDQDNAKAVIQKVIEHRFLLSALGLVPQKYGQWNENKKTGALIAFPEPKDSIKALGAVVGLMGMSLKASKKKVAGATIREYQIDAEKYEIFKQYSERRFLSKKSEKVALA